MNQLEHFSYQSGEFINHPSHAIPGIHAYPDKLHVITMLENPLRWRSRYANYWKFAKHVEDAGAILYTVEVAFENRKFEITEPNNPRHLQLRTKCEMWHKENAMNLMAAKLPFEAQKIACIDSDVLFARSDWAQECCHQLAHYDVIQMFSQIHNLGPNSEILTNRGGCMWNYIENRPAPHDPKFSDPLRAGFLNKSIYQGYSGIVGKRAEWQHTGFAWAYRRSAWDILGGMMEHCPLGSGDYHMAGALMGDVHISLNKHYPKRYIELCEIWGNRAKEIVNNPNGGVGYMPGAILHYFHGTTVNRNYNLRHKLLSRTGFNPDLHLKRDSQGLWQLTGDCREIRDGFRAYNRIRNEDSPDIVGMI